MTGSRLVVLLALLLAVAGCPPERNDDGNPPPPDDDDVADDDDDTVDGPRIVVDPEEIEFGVVPVGGVALGTVTVTNTGNDTLQIQDLILSDITRFSIANEGEFAQLLAAGGETDIVVAFSPSGSGFVQATMVIASNDRDVPEVLVRLAGEGAAPSIDLQPPSFDFGNLELGCTNEVEISIANEGTLPVVVSEVRYEDLAGAGELVVVSGPATPFELEPGDPEVVVIRYTPVDVEPDSGILTVGADDPLVGEATAQQFGIAHLGGSNLDTYFGDDVTTTFALTAVAHEETLGVALNGAPTFVGWVYVAATNAIEFDLDHIPATGDEVTVEYIVLGDCPD